MGFPTLYRVNGDYNKPILAAYARPLLKRIRTNLGGSSSSPTEAEIVIVGALVDDLASWTRTADDFLGLFESWFGSEFFSEGAISVAIARRSTWTWGSVFFVRQGLEGLGQPEQAQEILHEWRAKHQSPQAEMLRAAGAEPVALANARAEIARTSDPRYLVDAVESLRAIGRDEEALQLAQELVGDHPLEVLESLNRFSSAEQDTFLDLIDDESLTRRLTEDGFYLSNLINGDGLSPAWTSRALRTVLEQTRARPDFGFEDLSDSLSTALDYTTLPPEAAAQLESLSVFSGRHELEDLDDWISAGIGQSGTVHGLGFQELALRWIERLHQVTSRHPDARPKDIRETRRALNRVRQGARPSEDL
ncbi:MAG: hypothetical protein AAF196_12215 [Planctomycetota bacterium]